LCLALAVVPASAQVLYDNGPINGVTNSWIINFGFITSDTFTLLNNSTITGFNFGSWEYPGDVLTSVDWSITSQPSGGTLYASGTARGSNLTDHFISENQYRFDVDEITVTSLNVNLTSGTTYWLNLQNAMVPNGDPVYWDENQGVGCGGDDGKGGGCPSQAYFSDVGTIVSEAFTINGSGTSPVPEAGSFCLLASGVLGLAGLLPRKLL
jgi:hypothetical protein